MKGKKLLASAMACAMCLSVAAVLPETMAEYSITASAEDTYIEGTYDVLTYANYGEYIVITECAASATEVEIPSEIDGVPVTSIGYESFRNCYRLTSITIPGSVTSIDAWAFQGCENLTSITIPDGVTSIGHNAFGDCYSLTSITIPDSVTSIEEGVFSRCYSLTEIHVGESNGSYTLLDGVLFNEEITKLLCYPAGKSGDTYSIPGTVTTIGDDAFVGSESLTTITVPESVTDIGDFTFMDCYNLTSITIPDSVTSIGVFTFYYCTNLANITIPDSVISIEECAFYGCSELTSITIRNPYCQVYDAEYTIPETATIYGYSNSFAQHYAGQYGREFVVLEGEPAVQYTYEIIPLLSHFNEYFLVKTNNPDSGSFRFADKNSVYSEESVIVASSNQFADVKYDDPETLRVNDGYIFYSDSTDGGEVSLQLKTPDDTWMDFDVTVTLPTLYDDVDYLIQTYATESDFFANMDAVQSGFSSICLYSASSIRGELYQSDTYWSMSTSPHIDQHFYIYSPYDRRDGKFLFASLIYPFRFDSLGFPSIMAKVSQRLDSSSSYVWSETSHSHINVTYGGETRSYGGQGNGEGQGLSEDKISHFFTFDDSDLEITIENIRQLLDDYADVEMEDDIPREDALTWEAICNTVGDGTWVRVGGGVRGYYSYLYKNDSRNYYDAQEWGVGYSNYWGGSLGYGCDTWVDGRYINSYERYVPGETFEDHPESDIILFQVAIPNPSYEGKSQYNSETGQYEYVYSNIEISETIKNVRYTYNSNQQIWKADSKAITNSGYSAIIDMTEQGLIDEKYLDTLQLTYEEVVELDVDRNTNINPTHYYLYDGTAAPGTEIFMGDLNADTEINASDAAALLIDAAAVGAGEESGLTAEQETAADLNTDGAFDASDAALILQYAAYTGAGGTGTVEEYLNSIA